MENTDRDELFDILLEEEGFLSSQPSTILPKTKSDPPLSLGQQRLWFLQKLDPTSVAYHVPIAFRLNGNPNLELLEQSLNTIIRRHEQLRSTFCVENGQTIQRVASDCPFSIEPLDWQNCPEDEQEKKLQGYIRDELHKPFDLEKLPLFRATLIQMDKERFVLFFVIHHLIVDGWSLGILSREMASLYAHQANEAESDLPSLSVQFGDYACWQEEQLENGHFEEQLDYWKQHLSEAPQSIALPLLQSPSLPDENSCGVERFQLPTSLTQELKQLAQQNQMTLFVPLLSAFSILLSRYSSQDDLVIGTPVANRNHPEIENLIGFFANTLAIRIKIEGNPTLLDFLKQVQEGTEGAFAHQDLPYGLLVKTLQPDRNLKQNPLFQVMFDFQNFPAKSLELPELTLIPMELESLSSKFDLTLSMGESPEGLIGSFEFDLRRFDRQTVQRMCGHLHALLEVFIENLHRPLSQISLVSPQERHQLLVEWNQTATTYPSEMALHHLIEKQAERTPSEIALVFLERKMSYQELNQKANTLANELIGKGIGPGKFVPVLLGRSLEVPVAFLAIMKTGAAFVPLSIDWPVERINAIQKELESEFFIAPVLEFQEEQLAKTPANPNVPIPSKSPIYVIYTSGSTGMPKGAINFHQGIVNRFFAMNRRYDMSPSDVVLQTTAHLYDSAVWQLFWPLSWGGKSILPSDSQALIPKQLFQLIEENRVSLTDFVPSFFDLIVEHAEANPENRVQFESLRYLVIGGEAIRPHMVRRFQTCFPAIRLTNAYGPTETSIGVLFYEIPSPCEESIPIGKPLDNVYAMILDANLKPVPVGMPGMLYLGGDCLGGGYFRRKKETDAVFIKNPFVEIPGDRIYKTGDQAQFLPDGNIHYLGRADHQIKIRGFRVEPEEIEKILQQHPSIHQALVVKGGSSQNAQLIAHLISEKDGEKDLGALKSFLKSKLPIYMIPSHWIWTDKFPLTAGGKLDRKLLQLQPLPKQDSNAVLAGNETEQKIVEIWQEVLSLEEIGVHENFFDAGGHSLMLVRLQDRLQKTFGQEFPLVDLFQYPTIHSFASFLKGKSLVPSDQESEKASVERKKDLDEPIAIVGMACRFPGASNPETFWKNLQEGVESISFFAEDEVEFSALDRKPQKDVQYIRARGILEGVDQFDASLFGVSPREAEIMDPQHRLFLETCWEALETAGYCPGKYEGDTGVYLGVGMNTYLLNYLYPNREQLESIENFQVLITNEKDFLSTRISYLLDLKGPSVTLQTACSTSLVTIHMACQALRNRECDQALAGGGYVQVPQKTSYPYRKEMILSPDGHCRAFDADAQGTVASNGLGVVVLKRLSDALADGDSIEAIIKGSAINNDGSQKVSYTSPGVEGQVDVIRKAQASAGVHPETISYLEAHGTGTLQGDPIEIAALTRAFRKKTDKTAYCAMGSVKTNIGHLDSGAGVAGVIKTTLALKNQSIPPSLHFKRPNPAIDFENSPFYVNTRLAPWKTDQNPRRAGVSSFGIGGTNAHLILEEAQSEPCTPSSRPWHLIPFSAKSPSALETMTNQFIEHGRKFPETNLADLAHTLQVGRKELPFRKMVVAQSLEQMCNSLEKNALQQVFTESASSSLQAPVFLFPGQGAQHQTMTRELYQSEPFFRKQVDWCADLLIPHLKMDIRSILYPSDGTDFSEQLNQTETTQPLLFVIEYALARLWMAWGVQPQVLLGHSLGELVAACLAGVFSIEDALALVCTRGKLMQQLPEGGMLAVVCSEEDIQDLLEPGLSLAVVNSPTQCVVAGEKQALASLQANLEAKGVRCQKLPGTRAFHSPLVEPILEEFKACVEKIDLQTPKIPFFSNVTGKLIEPTEATSPDYWAKQLRQTARFSDSLHTLFSEPGRIFLEVGPGQTLGSLIKRYPDKPNAPFVFSSLPHHQEKKPEFSHLLTTAGKLWIKGQSLNPKGIYLEEKRGRVPLPTYPFERQRYWISSQISGQTNPVPEKRKLDDWFSIPSWKRSYLAPQVNDLLDSSCCLVFMDSEGKGKKIWQHLEKQVEHLIFIEPGESFAQPSEVGYTINPGIAEDYQTLLQALLAKGQKPTHFLHLWNWSSQPIASEKAQELAIQSPLFLVQALEQHNFFGLKQAEAIKLIMVSNAMQEVVGNDLRFPEKALLLGPVRCIPQEYPQIHCRSVDLSHSEGELSSQMVHQVVVELGTPSPDCVVAYRGNHRWVQSIESIQLPVPPVESIPLQEERVTLITGGLGGIGLTLAQHLGQKGKAKLILTGRSPFPQKQDWSTWVESHPAADGISQKIKFLENLESKGNEVLVCSANVADYDQMEKVIGLSLEKFGKIQGVIHAAGIAGGGVIALKKQDMIEQVLNPKVKGVLVLDQLLQQAPLDFFVLCSSLSSFQGTIGQVDYVAANAFLDAFVHHKNSNGDSIYRGINWDAWQQVGMAVNTKVPKELEGWRKAQLQKAILPGEGTEAFARIIGSPLPQVLVSTQPFVLQAAQDIGGGVQQESILEENQKAAPSGESRDLHARPELQTSFLAPQTPVEKQLADIWKEFLGLQAVGVHDNYLELGGDSLMATQTLTRMRDIFNVDLLLRDLFENQTISELANHIETKKWAEQNALDSKKDLPLNEGEIEEEF